MVISCEHVNYPEIPESFPSNQSESKSNKRSFLNAHPLHTTHAYQYREEVMQNPFQSISKVITEIPTKIKPAQEKAEESKIRKPITRFMDETILCPAEDTLNFFNS